MDTRTKTAFCLVIIILLTMGVVLHGYVKSVESKTNAIILQEHFDTEVSRGRENVILRSFQEVTDQMKTLTGLILDVQKRLPPGDFNNGENCMMNSDCLSHVCKKNLCVAQ